MQINPITAKTSGLNDVFDSVKTSRGRALSYDIYLSHMAELYTWPGLI